MMMLRPETVSAAALLRPMVPFADAPRADLSGKAVLLLSGVSDPIAPPVHAERLAHLFEQSGARVTRETLPLSHGLSQMDLTLTQRWLSTLDN
jgi:phospholipase/carboxylesterase